MEDRPFSFIIEQSDWPLFKEFADKNEYFFNQFFTGYSQEEVLKYYDPIHRCYNGAPYKSTTVEEYLSLVENMKLEIEQSQLPLHSKQWFLRDLNDWVQKVHQVQNYRLSFYSLVKDEMTLDLHMKEGDKLKNEFHKEYYQVKINDWMRWVKNNWQLLLHEFKNSNRIHKRFTSIEFP